MKCQKKKMEEQTFAFKLRKHLSFYVSIKQQFARNNCKKRAVFKYCNLKIVHQQTKFKRGADFHEGSWLSNKMKSLKDKRAAKQILNYKPTIFETICKNFDGQFKRQLLT